MDEEKKRKLVALRRTFKRAGKQICPPFDMQSRLIRAFLVDYVASNTEGGLSNDTRLTFYALFKQATEGPCT